MPKRDKLIRRQCAFCGEKFMAANPNARFDSARCRLKFFRWRKRLPACYARAAHEIEELADYLKFPDAHELAVRKIGQLERLLLDIDEQHDIRRVH